MVIINGIVASLVLNPIKINIEQKNSANIARKSDNSLPIPIGSGKPKSPEMNLTNFGYPWASIKPAIAIRRASNTVFMIGP